jgi:hypothetical protein
LFLYNIMATAMSSGQAGNQTRIQAESAPARS